MSGFVSGAKDYYSDSADHILDLKDGLEFLKPRNDGIDLLKRIGINGFTAKSPKFEWTETALATRGETITITDVATTLTVANAYQYQVNELIRIEAEIVRVTAVASATTLTVSRGYADTTAAAHTSKLAFTVGSADPENSSAPTGIADTGDRLYNYIQTFTRGVELSNDEIAQMSTDGNHMNGQVERRFIEIMQQLARAMFYGVRYEDTTNKIHATGGLKQFITTNVTNVGGALTIASIDAQILNIVNAGGDPKVIVLSPYQKQKLDALDTAKQMLGKREHTGGNLVTNTWQSGVLNHELDIIVDPSILTSELWIVDTDMINVGYLSNNGVVGSFHVEDATEKGKDGMKKVIRGKYGIRVETEKAHAYLYGLS